MSHSLDLRQSPNPKCPGCDRAERDDIDADGLCTKTMSVLDGLPVRCVGEWAYDKIYRLVQYFGTFAGGMSKKWQGLNYVEICSGPGRCITRNDRVEMDGTALAVIRSKQFPKLKKGIFIDVSPRVVDILNQRIKALDASHIAEAVVGDYSDAQGICRILDRLPDSCLNLVFIDPTECDVPFQTIKRLVAHLQNADLLINVALGTDVTRNIIPAILQTSHKISRAKYESFLGVPGFCRQPDVIKLAKLSDHDDLRRKFAETYNQILRSEGYQYNNVRQVKHYYYLLFASRSPKGLELWNNSCAIAPDNQRELTL
jgi:three-Cys-motif partner protein